MTTSRKKIKKTNYFSHDSNARNDSKIISLRMKLGVEGYGIYFMIIERLREEADYISNKDYDSLAFDFRTTPEKVKSVIEDFGLFIFTDDDCFYSESFMQRMKLKDEKSKKHSLGGKKAMEKRWNNIQETDKNNKDVITNLSNSDNIVITNLSNSDNKESKVKESKEGEKKKSKDVESLEPETLNPFEDLIKEVKPVENNSNKFDGFISQFEKEYVNLPRYAEIGEAMGLPKIQLDNYFSEFIAENKLSRRHQMFMFYEGFSAEMDTHFANWLKLKVNKSKGQKPPTEHNKRVERVLKSIRNARQ